MPHKTYPISGLVLLLLSLGYLSAELFFNVMLLDISSSVRSSPDQVEHVQYFGRTVSGLGFTLLVLSLFQRFGFKISGQKQWLAFAAIALLCILPFLMTFGHLLLSVITTTSAPPLSYTTEMIWGVLPFIGLYHIAINRGRNPVIVIIGLMVLAWPAMFYGQKLAIERFIINPTTAQERLNANYILLLKTGIEECAIAPQALQLCDDNGSNDVEKRSTRTVLGALFMLNPADAFKSLEPEQNKIIEGIATQGLWFAPREYYKMYLGKVARSRDEYAQFLHQHYYMPYKKASDLYLHASSEAYIEKTSEAATAQVEDNIEREQQRYEDLVTRIEDTLDQGRQQSHLLITKIDAGAEQGWQQYQQAVADYHTLIEDESIKAAQDANELSDAYTQACAGRNCPKNILRKKYNDLCHSGNCGKISTGYIIQRARQIAEQKFYEDSGYPSNIPDKATFLNKPETKKRLREEVEENIRTETGNTHFTLPQDWQYTPAGVQAILQSLIQKKLREEVENTIQAETKNQDFKLADNWKYMPATFRASFQSLIQEKILYEVESNIRDKTGDQDFTLPSGWKYDPATFKTYMQGLIRQKTQEGWSNKSQAQFNTVIPPGLDQDAFFRYLKIDPLPSIEKLAMSESDFMRGYTVPLNQKISYDTINKIRNEAPAYANGQGLESKGKDYVRVLYVPAIALCISLIIVVLTIGRNLVNAACWSFQKTGLRNNRLKRWRNIVRPASWGVFLILACILPYAWTNPYLDNPAYQTYYQLAKEKAFGTTLVLDWVAHMQPTIYRAGQFLQAIF
ncbi:MAG: hypothetical protein HY052_08960 [Proteobacteria bacterium]|nr:hypothetical protein [Pseudomonadota bacterium]